MNNNQEQYICKTDGFIIDGFPNYKQDVKERARVNRGDIVQVDSKGYLWKDEFRLFHKDCFLGKRHFKKFQK